MAGILILGVLVVFVVIIIAVVAVAMGSKTDNKKDAPMIQPRYKDKK